MHADSRGVFKDDIDERVDAHSEDHPHHLFSSPSSSSFQQGNSSTMPRRTNGGSSLVILGGGGGSSNQRIPLPTDPKPENDQIGETGSSSTFNPFAQQPHFIAFSVSRLSLILCFVFVFH